MPPMLSLASKPTFILGVNYWSRAGGPRMWDRFDARVVKRELAQMRRLGLNTCRSFTFLPSFMPHPPEVDRAAMGRFTKFLSLCKGAGMSTIPSFLVGHMSGENYDFPGQEGRSPYTDPSVLEWQGALITEIAAAGHASPAVIAYLASNEMPRWGGPATPEIIAGWARTLRRALRATDNARPFSLGDGVMNLDGGQDGFDPRALTGLIDFVGPHTYYTDADPFRQAYNAEFCLRAVSHVGLPVLLEEYGCSSAQASEDNQLLYYREVLHACLSAGAAGALSWCFSDFDLETEKPYQHHAFELGFGLTRADGTEKPVCDEIRRTAALIDTLHYHRLRHPTPRAAILVPAYFNTSFPFSWEDRQRMRRTLLQAYALCADAGLETELVPEDADLSRYKLVMAPSTQKLLATTWRELLQHAAAGNTVYWSYFATDTNVHQGAWCHIFPELTGCRHLLRYACFDLPEDLTRVAGSGLSMELDTRVGAPYPRSYLPIEPLSAEILARDGRGRPALTRAPQGRGEVLFLNHPWEYYLAEQHRGLAHGAGQLYALLARRAGLEPRVRCEDAGVQARLVGKGRSSLLWLFNHGWEPTAAAVDSPGGEPLFGGGARLGEGLRHVELSPKQAIIYRLSGPR